MECNIILLIGMAVAFVIGAFVRKPFVLPKKDDGELKALKDIIRMYEDKTVETPKSDYDRMMSYTGESQDED